MEKVQSNRNTLFGLRTKWGSLRGKSSRKNAFLAGRNRGSDGAELGLDAGPGVYEERSRELISLPLTKEWRVAAPGPSIFGPFCPSFSTRVISFMTGEDGE